MAVPRFSINSGFHGQCLSSAEFLPTPTGDVIYVRSEYLYTPVDTYFFLLASNVKQKNGVQGKDSSSMEGLSIQLQLGGDSYLECLIARYPFANSS